MTLEAPSNLEPSLGDQHPVNPSREDSRHEPKSSPATWRKRAARGAARLGKFLFSALGLLILAGIVYEAVAGLMATHRYPPPGDLYDIGGYRLHLNCIGEGEPTILLEAGLGRDSLDWSWVQPGLAEHSRTCSYDRAGSGWSDPGPLPRDSRSIAGELHELLASAGIEEPLMLVGHSAGGSFVQLFEHLFPESVAGMVLVDVTHRQESLQKPPPEAMVQFAKLLRFTGVMRLFGLIDGKDLPEEAQAAENSLVYRPNFLSTMVAENEGVALTLPQVREVGVAGSLGDLPLLIVTAAGPVDDLPRPRGMTLEEARQDLALRHRLQSEMLALSSNSRQVMADRSGHQIHKDQPELVVEVVGDLVEQVKARLAAHAARAPADAAL